ncbi:hypothetical protein [Paractinoplanes brasiliensis]|uniref:Sulfotransferase family protein n=1 Tax=Paractinoplanes brasiliensis TaxID=52695 RepID=A0A4R6JAD6_9ACTN|nr:hypothetical protein [Actinoplanes brasiliensis]TDO32217.1 hypothetical protein C8E87_7669 [Actinoplanes brasiliensis]GID28271.1 hypothetical protein Abr02nite_32540 [Actinoplanes brasiliensis]
MAGRVFVHIGAPKTGSTYVQNVLWNNVEKLRHAGILLPGYFAAHDEAMADLRGLSWHANPSWSWERLVAKAAGWPGDVVITNEGLGAATDAQAARAVRSLQPAEVHVLVAARDLWRTFPSMWQQSIRARGVWSFEDFIGAVEHGRFDGFWEHHTANRMLRRWGDLVPAGQRHLITVPGPGMPQDTLWRRFAGVIGIPDGICDLTVAAGANTSLGAAEVEVLRRVNRALGDRYPHRAPYQRVVQRHLVDAVLKQRTNDVRFGVGPQRAEWVLDLAEQQIKELDEYPCDVVGDLAELRPVDIDPVPPPDQLDRETVLDAAIETIIGMIDHAEQLTTLVPKPRESLRRRASRKVKRGLKKIKPVPGLQLW